MRITTRSTLAALAGLVGLAAISAATPAMARDHDGDHDRWEHRGGWDHRGWGWGHYKHRRPVVVVDRPYYGYRPYYVPPAPVYVAPPRYYVEPAPVWGPPPVYVAPAPSINVTIPLR